MTKTNSLHAHPKFIKIAHKNVKTPLIIHGQGVFVFGSVSSGTECSFVVMNKANTSGLSVVFKTDGVFVHKMPSYEPLVDENNVRGLSSAEGAYYWFSLDSQNGIIAAGIGEARIETCVYHYMFSMDEKAFLESMTAVIVVGDSSAVQPLRILRDPIAASVPMLVKRTDEITMDMLAEGSFLPKSFISPSSQKLFDSISGPKFTLNDANFPDFDKAIEYSIATPGCWCNTTLKNKVSVFGGGELETYLRITLGRNNGESPGIPHVMEIWPLGHYSPVHDHGGANAIIRVLHGNIDVMLYPFLSKDIDAFKQVQLKKGDITWISPSLNQVHKLVNPKTNAGACITVQCYMYDKSDTLHYDFFDYLDGDGKEQQFEPDSDMDFRAFKELIKKEWAAHKRDVALFYFLEA